MERAPGHRGPPGVRECICRALIRVRANVEAGHPGLLAYPVIESSILLGKQDSNLWITADEDWFYQNLRHVAVRQSPTWGFRVSTDADIIQAWLATDVAKGAQMFDADLAEVAPESLTHLTLHDIALPPHLLVIRVGVKAARNAALPEVLMEAVNLRLHARRATWIWDQADKPLSEGHRAYSAEVGNAIRMWEHITPRVSQQQGSKGAVEANLRDMLFTTGPSQGRKR